MVMMAVIAVAVVTDPFEGGGSICGSIDGCARCSDKRDKEMPFLEH